MHRGYSFNKSQEGQMLVIVFVVLMLLFFILFAVISNVMVDMRETQVEREYEEGYSLAESELIKIGKNSLDEWMTERGAQPIDAGTVVGGVQLINFCTEAEYECHYAQWTEDGEERAVIIKNKSRTGDITGEILKDKTLEVPLAGASPQISLSWTGAPALSVILVCDTGSGYTSNRAVVCRGAVGGNCGIMTSLSSGGITVTEARSVGRPLNLSTCGGATPVLLRLRAIGAGAMNVDFGGTIPEDIFYEIHVQGFPAGFELSEELPAPELYFVTYAGNKQLPALFDYVLFTAQGDAK